MKHFLFRPLPTLFLAALLGGLGSSRAFCEGPDSTSLAKPDAVETRDSGSVSLSQETQPDSLVVQEGEQVVPEQVTAQKDEESRWDWQAIAVIISAIAAIETLIIAVVGWWFIFYQISEAKNTT